MFRKLFASVALALCAVTAFAGQTAIDTSGLTDAQIAELKAIAAKKVADVANNVGTPATSPGALVTLAATWGPQMAAAAEGFARALGIAARELNITVNEFLASDAGKLTAALIIWKVAGAAVVKMLYGMLFITVGLCMVRLIYLKLFTKGYEKVEYARFGGFFKGTKMVRVPKGFQDLRNDGEWLAFWVMIGLTIATMGIGAAIII
jgi:hypothetical protein